MEERDTPTVVEREAETETATPQPLQKPGNGVFCRENSEPSAATLPNFEAICNSAGGKFNIFGGVSCVLKTISQTMLVTFIDDFGLSI